LYQWLEHLEAAKLSQERRRLLYVAATRAKRWLHLFGTCQLKSRDEGGPTLVRPSASVALGMLWPVVEHEFAARLSIAADVGAIVNAHLFGVAGATDAGSGDPGAVAATQMALVLVGTIAHTDPAKGYAIIGDSAATAKVYAVGKTITGGTKLHAVYADRVILDRGGKSRPCCCPRNSRAVAWWRRHPAAGRQPMLGQRLQELVAQNPGAITEIIRPQPCSRTDSSAATGVPGPQPATVLPAGLMPGDLVTAINGTPLDDRHAHGDPAVHEQRDAGHGDGGAHGQSSQININNAAWQPNRPLPRPCLRRYR